MFPFFGQLEQVFTISVLAQGLSHPLQVGTLDPTIAPRDFLDAGDLEALSLLNGFDEVRSLLKRGVRTRIEPSDASAEFFYCLLYTSPSPRDA